MNTVKNKVVLITEALNDIGRATTRAFAGGGAMGSYLIIVVPTIR